MKSQAAAWWHTVTHQGDGVWGSIPQPVNMLAVGIARVSVFHCDA